MVSIMEVSLEELSPALRLNSRGCLQTSVSFALKWEGIRMVGFLRLFSQPVRTLVEGDFPI